MSCGGQSFFDLCHLGMAVSRLVIVTLRGGWVFHDIASLASSAINGAP